MANYLDLSSLFNRKNTKSQIQALHDRNHVLNRKREIFTIHNIAKESESSQLYQMSENVLAFIQLHC